MAHTLKTTESVILHVIGDERFEFPFLCSDQLSQWDTLGHKFAKALGLGLGR